MKDEPLSRVLHATTAAQVWTKLCQHYKGKGKQTIAYLIGDLFQGMLSDDSLIAIAMVISLPPSYSTLCTVLMSTDDKLSVDEQKCCKKIGHLEDDCHRKKADEAAKTTVSDEKNKANERDKGELNAKVANMSSADMTYLQLFLANMLDTTLDKHWIVDSGATAQMVTIGNGNTVLTTTTGCINLDMHLVDGRTGHVALQTVYYVPGLNANLLSVLYLASRGGKVVFKSSTCSIITDNKTRVTLPTYCTKPLLNLTSAPTFLQ